jgi:hypothetical protein
MSTRTNDLASAALVRASLAPSQLTASANGSAVDLVAADGPCFAAQQVGAVTGELSLAGRIEESANGTSWAAIPGATFATVTDGSDFQTITFHRTARFVRWAATVSGTTPTAQVAVVIGSQKKTI